MSFDPSKPPITGRGQSDSNPQDASLQPSGLRPPDPFQPMEPVQPEAPELLRALHPSSLGFDLLSHSRRHLFPAAMAIFGAASGNLTWLFIASIAFLLSILRTLVRYMTLRFGVRQGELVVTEGLIFRRVRTIPVNRIQNIDLVQNVFHRMFDVAEVRIETASGSEPEAYLRVIKMDEVAALRNEVFSPQAGSSEAIEALPVDETESTPLGTLEPTSPHEASFGQSGAMVLEIPVSWLLKAGLASNRGLVMVGILVGIASQFDFWEHIDFERVEEYVPQSNNYLATGISVAIGLIGFLLAMRVVGVIWYVLRFHGYQLRRNGDDLRVSCGLFTKVSATIPRRRIQFISVHRPLLLRFMGFCSLRIETAGGSAKESESASSTISRRWLVPVVTEDLVPKLLNEFRPQLAWDSANVDWRPVSPKAGRRLCRMAIIRSTVVALTGLAIIQPWGLLAGVVLLPLELFLAIRQSRAMHYARTPFGVAYRSGILRKIMSLTFFERMQTLRLDQSPFDRRWRMATLMVDTAGAGPAGHRIHIKYLDEKFAKSEFDSLVSQASQHQPEWL